jgi:hypothetical protein
MKNQLLILLINRLGGTVAIPVAEIDGTGGFNLAMRLDPTTRVFTFQVLEKGKATAETPHADPE